MADIKHTIGPWTFEKDWYGDYTISPTHEALAVAAVVNNGMRDPSETEANAHLVATAPELLAALKHLTEYVEGVNDPDLFPEEAERIAIARAAILKAEGQS